MKYLYIAFVLMFAFVHSALAHEHFVDGSVKATLYYDPHHAPVAGARTMVNIDFIDTTPALDFTACNCQFSILHDGNSVFTGAIGDGTIMQQGNVASFPFVFKASGEYTIKATGTQNGKPFALSDTEMVAPAGTSDPNENALVVHGDMEMSHAHGIHNPVMMFEMILMALAPILAGILVFRIRLKERRALAQ